MTGAMATLPGGYLAIQEEPSPVSAHQGILLLVAAQMSILLVLNSLGSPGGAPVMVSALAPVAVASLIQPFVGLATLFALLPFDALFQVAAGAFTGSKLVAIFVGMGYLMRCQRREYTLLPNEPVTRLAAAYVGLVLLSSVWSLRPLETFIKATSPVLLLLLTIMGVQMINSRRRLLTVLVCFGVSAGMAGIMMTFRIGINIAAMVTRLTIGGTDANTTCRTLVLGFFALCYATWAARSWLARICMVSFMPFILIGLLQTQSRQGLAALVLGSLAGASLGSRGDVGKKLLNVVGLMVIGGLLAGVVWLSGAVGHETFSRWQQLRGGAGGRMYIFKTGMEVIRDHPVLGTGHAMFGTGYTEIAESSLRYGMGIDRDAHSSYLTTWAELGPLGLVLFVSVMIALARSAFRTRRGPEGMLGVAMVTLIGMTTLTATLWPKKYFYNSLVLIVAVARLHPKRTEDEYELPYVEAYELPGGLPGSPDALSPFRPVG